ncbi:DUF6447 family protein [Alkalimarinus alittae]|uniref:DUF6447 family protein n=1 Tax=Alkalimarinus alittae TaxID=2961619 RepID=A0ABY6MZ83_9ALTE|nr:DUF6447 family protein [Alkalimarinus alittae]UZE95135.1 DUF6447 family protein [Alkalimarinus alittae]
MAKLTIDDKQYEIDKLPPEAKAKLDSARFCEQKIEQLEAEIAIARTARAAYLQSLPSLLTDDALSSSSANKTNKKPASMPKKAAIRKSKTTIN